MKKNHEAVAVVAKPHGAGEVERSAAICSKRFVQIPSASSQTWTRYIQSRLKQFSVRSG